MLEQLNSLIEARALAFADANRIAQVGEIVETTWGGWKQPRKVRVTKIGAHLIADWSEERGFFVDFDMTYVAHRIRKDGSSTEREQTGGICLNQLRTEDGREWRERSLISRNAKWFNHTALSWKLDGTPAPQPNVDVENKIARVVQSVNEWDDRTSPDDYPDHLLITSEELTDILRNFSDTLEGSDNG